MRSGGRVRLKRRGPWADGDISMDSDDEDALKSKETEWAIVAEQDASHSDFEVNHVVWASRGNAAAKVEEDEVLISCGDDGAVNIWTLDL